MKKTTHMPKGKAFFSKHLVLILLTAFISTVVLGQELFDKYTVDTFRLPEFHARKIVAYRLQQVTVYVNYQDFYEEFLILYNRYRDGIKEIEKDGSQRDESERDYERRFRILDSTYEFLRTRVIKADTLHLTHAVFARYQFRELIEIDNYIENGSCAITDNRNNRHYVVIRQKGSWYRGPKNAWGGRRYFLPGRSAWFFEATDWIS